MNNGDIKGARPEIAYLKAKKNYSRDTLDTRDIT